MNRAICVLALVALVALIPLAGCLQDGPLAVFQKQNPEINTAPIYEEGNEYPVVYVHADGGGNPILDANGEMTEVPGTRRAASGAKADDELLSSELSLWGQVIPGGAILTLIAGIVSRWKPNQRLKQYRNRFDETVESIQVYRNTLTPEAKAAMAENIGRVSTDTRDAISDFKTALSKAKADTAV